MARRIRMAVQALVVLLAVPPLMPEALAFPYHRTVGDVSVWSEAPIASPAIDHVLWRAEALVRASPIDLVPTGRHVFLTQGGWRWHWLALGASGAMGLTRPWSEAVIVNRADVAGDRVASGTPTGGVRSLSGVIAHERTHGLMRARYGIVGNQMLPLWLREGYPDYVAKESSLSDAQAAALRRARVNTPALAYHDGRRRVAAALAVTGGSVDRLVAQVAR